MLEKKATIYNALNDMLKGRITKRNLSYWVRIAGGYTLTITRGEENAE